MIRDGNVVSSGAETLVDEDSFQRCRDQDLAGARWSFVEGAGAREGLVLERQMGLRFGAGSRLGSGTDGV